MHPSITIAISNIEIAVGTRDHFGWLVKGAGSAQNPPAVGFATGIGRLATFTDQPQRLTVECVLQDHVVVAIGQVGDIVFDIEAVRICNRALTPRAEVIAEAIENQDWGVLSLKRVNAIL